jgi:NitT/TauT family transport system substrate-binding protein
MHGRAVHKPVSAPEKVTIAYSLNPNSALVVIAQKQGYYRQEGLEVSEHLHPYGKAALQDVLEGKADFATVAETPVVFAIMKGEKISIIATIQTTGGNNAIIARKDRGIAASADLKGRRIGVTFGTSADFFLDTYLAVNGIARKDVKVADLTQEDAVEALANGSIDAASVFYPYLNKAKKKLGERGVVFSKKDLYIQTFNIVAKQELFRRQPETVKKMLRSLVKAEDFLTRNPGEAQKIVADFMQVNLESVRESWADATFAVTLDQSLLLAMEDESEWAIKNKLTDMTEVPNYLDFIYFEGLQSVKPDAVRILR